MITNLNPSWRHAESRFQLVTESVIHQLQGDFFAGRSLEGSIPDLSGDKAAVIVAESLEADIIWNLDPQELMQGAVKKRRECDFLNAALAEICFAVSDTARDIDNVEAAKDWWAVAMSSLEAIVTSPTASPILDYGAIFWELSQKSRDDTNDEAIHWLEMSLAHTLRFRREDEDAIVILRDLAELYLEVGQFDQGLRIMTAVLRQNPADIWTYNVIGISFDRNGLPELGSQAIQRGLQLIEARGDPERLHDQLIEFQENMEAAEKNFKSDVTPLILTRFQEALQLHFDAAQPVPPELLCLELVPYLDKIPVKRPLISAEFPLPNPEHILPFLLDERWETTKGKPRHRHKKRGGSKDRGRRE